MTGHLPPLRDPGDRQALVDLDKAHVWHPFTQMEGWLAGDPLVIAGAEGCWLIDADGRRFLDGVSSLWVTVHGHRVPEIDRAITDQLGRVAHSTLLGLANTPSAELAARLVALSPPSMGPGLTKVFYSEAGACAVEIALKMAFGYCQHTGKPEKRTFLSLDNAYHGDTLGAVSVGGIDLFHAAYRPLLFPAHRAPSPYCYRCPLGKQYPGCLTACLRPLEEALEEHHEELCAVIVEPLMQAAGGMIAAPPGYLRQLSELCEEYEVLLILDEVATGVGRTGTFFACEQEGVSPDILVAGKGLTGGYLPLAVTMTTQAIFDAFLGRPEDARTFFHGHTYTGNPLACAAALANLDLMEANQTLAGVRERSEALGRALKPLEDHPHVGEVRRRGLMVGIELVADRATRQPFDPALGMGWRVATQAREHGVLIRPLGDVVVLMPPLGIPFDELDLLARVTVEAVEAATKAPGPPAPAGGRW
ncbi:MAG TPA: adenosylmethionine--8-amino-7-oxononanoate transaminase [Actinomycetota bacterium]|nr:adenosylmethionine--8-amino-7-oxononanoate transaminase [Actinomycetota bacterium]